METSKELIAHIATSDSQSFQIQSLQEHAEGVARLAELFAMPFQAQTIAQQIGILHDIGKASEIFQSYIRSQSGYDTSHMVFKADHKYTGAAWCHDHITDLCLQVIAEYCIAGHHSGLPDASKLQENMKAHAPEAQKIALQAVTSAPQLQFPSWQACQPQRLSPENLHHWIRMLFSALTDADYLDTERFMQPDQAQARHVAHHSIDRLLEEFETHMASLHTRSQASEINQIRQQIFDQAQTASFQAQGIYTFTVPTGGGKTLSSMAWALRHAQQHHLSRIIVVIPYTSIITQTAQVYRNIFGEEQVLEHHSNMDEENLESPSDDNAQELNNRQLTRHMATENWDAPIIVTTNVQFFESLFANKPAKCRKLHHIAQSVVIFDEAQMLPTQFLKPILGSLTSLHEMFGCSILLMSATLPPFVGAIGQRNARFTALSDTTKELISAPHQLQDQLCRAHYRYHPEAISTEELCQQLLSHPRVLCIVNSRKSASQIYEQLEKQPSHRVIHLSRNMCSKHLMQAITEIKQAGEMVVISTQLIEAGVDIDFPIVYRELAGLDSIAQAGGRCNREGLISEGGTVHIFSLEGSRPFGVIAKGANTTREVLSSTPDTEILHLETMKRYFDLFYGSLNTDFDEARVSSLLCSNPLHLDFATVARDFRLITEQGYQIIVNYREGAELIRMLKDGSATPHTFRQLQHYTVSLSEANFREIFAGGMVEWIDTYGIWVQCDTELYHPIRGVVIRNKYMEDILIA